MLLVYCFCLNMCVMYTKPCITITILEKHIITSLTLLKIKDREFLQSPPRHENKFHPRTVCITHHLSLLHFAWKVKKQQLLFLRSNIIGYITGSSRISLSSILKSRYPAVGLSVPIYHPGMSGMVASENKKTTMAMVKIQNTSTNYHIIVYI